MLERILIVLVVLVLVFWASGGISLVRGWLFHRKWRRELDRITLENAVRAQAFHNEVSAFRHEYIEPLENEILCTSDPEKVVLLESHRQDLEAHVESWAKDAMLRSLYAVQELTELRKQH